jgi:hypothetical protein
VIELLTEQHRQIRQLFDSMHAASGTDRDAACVLCGPNGDEGLGDREAVHEAQVYGQLLR